MGTEETNMNSVAAPAYSGIPTTYRGVRMRSRLEARWAAFFDDIGWEWHYEPFDLNGYIPDYLLSFDSDLLVEVKPELCRDDLAKYCAKVEQSGWIGDVLIVGATLWDLDHVHPVLGLFGEIGQASSEWSEARVVLCISCGNLTPIPADAGWVCRRCGYKLDLGDMGEARRVVDMWSEAGNRVQWRPR